MAEDTKVFVNWAGGTIISLLLAGNIFFIKRLVDKIDSQGDIINSLVSRLDLMQYRLNEIQRSE